MANPRGNQGYGKTEMVKANVDKFSPKFWELMGIYADSRDVEKEKFFMTEFNKLQTKMIPQMLEGNKDKPIPIMSIPYVPTDNSDTEDSEDVQESTGSTGGDIGQQDDINPAALDSVIASGQESEAD